MHGNLRLRAVVYRGESAWVAQALEHDIAAFADKPDDLPAALRKAITANLVLNLRSGREGLDGIPPAPARFAELYEHSRMNVLPTEPSVGKVEADLRLVEMA
ncbi:MAG TPA: hypothetical protein VG248_02805 [Caulobacteraceae bacterium]|jgi:hypothetical protein|nr:hypothetical protein [Caulobacteraceae bacterium]